MTPAQVLICWGRQRYSSNLISIPKSSNAERIQQNLAACDRQLSDEQMGSIDALECGFRYFISYLKRPENERTRHDGVLETGTDADYVSRGSSQ